MISYYVGKSINVSNSHLLKDGNAMLYISLGIERWYQRTLTVIFALLPRSDGD
jgi:hypothetical protein